MASLYSYKVVMLLWRMQVKERETRVNLDQKFKCHVSCEEGGGRIHILAIST